LSVGGLVVGDDVGAFSANGLIDSDDDNALLNGRLDDGVQAFAVGGVEDDGIDTLGNETFQVSDLFGGATIAVDDDHLVHQAASGGFGLDGADHLLAPAIADEGVANADNIAAIFARTSVIAGTGADDEAED
jgi:hypothetical protein